MHSGLASLLLSENGLGNLLRSSVMRPGQGLISRRRESSPAPGRRLPPPAAMSTRGQAHHLLLGHPQQHVQQALEAGHAIVTDAWHSVAARLTSLRGSGAWRLPLAPPMLRGRRSAPADEGGSGSPLSSSVVAAAGALVMQDGQVAAAVPARTQAADRRPALLPFLVAADQVEISHAALLADLSNMAYSVTEVSNSRLEHAHALHLVATSAACTLPSRGAVTTAARAPGRQARHSDGSDAVVVAAAAAGCAAAAAAASDAPPPVLLLPMEAAAATAAAALASPPASPLVRSPRTSLNDGGGSGVLLSPRHAGDPPAVSPRGPSAVSFVDLSSPKAAASTLGGGNAPSRPVFLSDYLAGSMASYTDDWDDHDHLVPANVNYLPAVNAHVATQLPDPPAAVPPAPLVAAPAAVAAAAAAAAAAQAAAQAKAMDLAMSPHPAGGWSSSGSSSSGSSSSSQETAGRATAAAGPDGEGAPDCDPAPPTAWFSCDDPITKIRHFVLQGSTSWEHWQINMQFDPVVFEDKALGVRIHRGVYDTACVLYDDLLPLVRQHLATSPFATISFTGHSLGGGLATAIMLLFVCRGEVDARAIAPVYTFGAPAIFCQEALGDDADPSAPTGRCSACALTCELSGQALGGLTASSAGGGAYAAAGLGAVHGAGHACPRATGLLKALKLTEEHVVNVIMHKDIVPRVFMCDFNPVADLLKRWWPSFQDHSTLQPGEHQSLYHFIGRVALLRPSDACTFVVKDGHHDMLPRTPALYKLYDQPPAGHRRWDSRRDSRQHTSRSGSFSASPATAVAAPTPAPRAPANVKEALTMFMNSPHPLTVLADYRAYGANGSISRYHNPDNYTKALTNLLC